MSKKGTNYAAIAKEMSNHVDRYFARELEQRTRAQSKNENRFKVLSLVVNCEYEDAITALEEYVESKNIYPRFVVRSEPYVKYGKSLIRAIESKRNVSMLSNLSLARQQDLLSKVVEHFEELTDVLLHITKMEKEDLVLDMRSTVWFVKVSIHSAFVLTLFGITYEVIFGMSDSFFLVFDDLVYSLVDKILSFV